MPQSSTPRQPHAGNSSETSASTPTRFSARAAVWSPAGDPAAEQPLREAADLFSSMGYRPALAETEALLEQTNALPS